MKANEKESTKKASKYVAKKPDANGRIPYTEEENQIWHELYLRQSKIIENRCCDEYIEGLEILKMPVDRIPQPEEISVNMRKATGWSVAPVPALIPYERFFNLLANRQFPAASFIRLREELDYLQEPDIFHELYGHCPLLTNQTYADFMCEYGKLGVNATDADRFRLARLYWFTVEFGLINTRQGIRSYGGGILSSMSETVYAVESPLPERKPFDTLTALRTPYRIDILQTVYYVINDFKELYDILQTDVFALIKQARELGEFPPTFPTETK